MGKKRIKIRITAGVEDSQDMLDWIAAYASYKRNVNGDLAWSVTKRDVPNPLGDYGPLHKAEIELTLI